MDPLLLSLVSASTALVASVVGPFVTLAVAKRQFNATVLSANRQKWIETLRDLLAELISMLVAAFVVKSRWKGEWNKGLGAVAMDPALLPKVERLVLVQWKIRLLLNPTEKDHQELSQAIDRAMERLKAEASAESDTKADVENITKAGRAILKREWTRVKRGT